MAQGVVRWFNQARKFGFIETDNVGGDVFFHATRASGDAVQEVGVGDRVEFDIIELTRHRLRAHHLRKLDLTPAAE